VAGWLGRFLFLLFDGGGESGSGAELGCDVFVCDCVVVWKEIVGLGLVGGGGWF